MKEAGSLTMPNIRSSASVGSIGARPSPIVSIGMRESSPQKALNPGLGGIRRAENPFSLPKYKANAGFINSITRPIALKSTEILYQRASKLKPTLVSGSTNFGRIDLQTLYKSTKPLTVNIPNASDTRKNPDSLKYTKALWKKQSTQKQQVREEVTLTFNNPVTEINVKTRPKVISGVKMRPEATRPYIKFDYRKPSQDVNSEDRIRLPKPEIVTLPKLQELGLTKSPNIFDSVKPMLFSLPRSVQCEIIQARKVVNIAHNVSEQTEQAVKKKAVIHVLQVVEEELKTEPKDKEVLKVMRRLLRRKLERFEQEFYVRDIKADNERIEAGKKAIDEVVRKNVQPNGKIIGKEIDNKMPDSKDYKPVKSEIVIDTPEQDGGYLFLRRDLSLVNFDNTKQAFRFIKWLVQIYPAVRKTKMKSREKVTDEDVERVYWKPFDVINSLFGKKRINSKHFEVRDLVEEKKAAKVV